MMKPFRRRRDDERGVAMFLTMMLIVMVSAAGVFVAKSSSLEVRSAGYVRQAGQTHYLTESGLFTSLARLRGSCALYFNTQLRQSALGNRLTACPRTTTPNGIVTLPCIQFTLTDFDGITISGSPSRAPLFAPATGTPRVAGSFGIGALSPGLLVTVTELGADTAPRVGSDTTVTSSSSMPSRMQITSVGTTQFPSSVTDTTNVARGQEQARAITTVPCN